MSMRHDRPESVGDARDEGMSGSAPRHRNRWLRGCSGTEDTWTVALAFGAICAFEIATAAGADGLVAIGLVAVAFVLASLLRTWWRRYATRS